MRYKFIFLFLLSGCGYLFSQNSKISELSNAEKFLSKSGTLIKKEFIDIGKIRSIQLQIAKFSDLISGDTASALRFESYYSTSYTSKSIVALLDKDEISGLISTFQMIRADIITKFPDNYTEVSYKSRSGFDAGCFSKDKNWKIYLKLDKYDDNSFISLSKEDISDVLNVLQLAKTKL